MTPEQIIEMAKQAKVSIRGHYDETGSTPAELQAFAQLVRNETLLEAQSEAAMSPLLSGNAVLEVQAILRKLKS